VPIGEIMFSMQGLVGPKRYSPLQLLFMSNVRATVTAELMLLTDKEPMGISGALGAKADKSSLAELKYAGVNATAQRQTEDDGSIWAVTVSMCL
jgi:hypothetical protein